MRDGGALWIGTDEVGRRNTAVIKEGLADRLRTHQNGCTLSVTATGEGALGPIRRMNIDKNAYLSRNGFRQEGMLNVKFYRSARKVGAATSVAQGPIPSTTHQTVEVVRGSTWLGVSRFYLSRLPGPFDVEIPLILSA